MGGGLSRSGAGGKTTRRSSRWCWRCRREGSNGRSMRWGGDGRSSRTHCDLLEVMAVVMFSWLGKTVSVSIQVRVQNTCVYLPIVFSTC